ncbi:MAG: GNAT family N-acetyltransferase [Spirochaetaceae bacterium]|nr:MAG: GNAT family N-acetyltransferase [Spirochaetaceae bacterium]
MPIEERIDDHFILRTIRDEKDITNFADFLTSKLNIVEGMTANCLMRFHPRASKDNFLVVEDAVSGRIVSTSGIIPWEMKFDEVRLNCVQVELILTDPEYRNKGLVRHQMQKLYSMAEQQRYDLVFIWGIPYYYRQFGYSYCIDGLVHYSLPSWRVDGEEEDAGCALREACTDDIPLLVELYDHLAASLDICLTRESKHWEYLLNSAKFHIYIVEKGNRSEAVGYLMQITDKKMIHILENSFTDFTAGMAVLRLFKKSYEEMRINWPKSTVLAQLAESLGGTLEKDTQWLFRILNLPALMEKLSPVFNKRLQSSKHRRMCGDFVLNLFHNGYKLRIREGKLDGVEEVGFVDTLMGAEGGDLNIQQDAFIRLLLGQNDIDELYEYWPDLFFKPESRALISVLFPRMDAYLYTPYHYYGPEIYKLEEKYHKYYF